jgi:hypothetical protein
VTLSSSEAEYVAFSELAKDIVFTTSLIEELMGKADLPSIAYEDNTGVIFMVNNHGVGQRTKHIDIRYRFVHELVRKNLLSVHYVKSKDNVADCLTKNLKEEDHKRHTSSLRHGRFGNGSREDVKEKDAKSKSGPTKKKTKNVTWDKSVKYHCREAKGTRRKSGYDEVLPRKTQLGKGKGPNVTKLTNRK